MADRAALNFIEPLQSVCEALPPHLEELQPELLDVFRWLEEPANAKPWTSSDAAVELIKCLNDIAQYRLVCYPNLRKVVVWQPNEDYFTCRARVSLLTRSLKGSRLLQASTGAESLCLFICANAHHGSKMVKLIHEPGGS